MAIPRIEDLTEPPTVGRYYIVPCVTVTYAGSDNGSVDWPITGPLHEDAQHIDFPPRHWHYDFRFVKRSALASMGWRPHGHVLYIEVQITAGNMVPTHNQTFSAPFHKKLKCLREAPPYPHDSAERAWLPKLRAAYCDKVVTCGKCPHRGLPIASLPREPGTDIVTCPGHGLRWDLVTGKLVPPEPK